MRLIVLTPKQKKQFDVLVLRAKLPQCCAFVAMSLTTGDFAVDPALLTNSDFAKIKTDGETVNLWDTILDVPEDECEWLQGEE